MVTYRRRRPSVRRRSVRRVVSRLRRTGRVAVARRRKRKVIYRRGRTGIRRIGGRGDYWTDGGARSLIETGGGVLGAGLGGMAGAALGPVGIGLGGLGGLTTGYEAGHSVANIFGMGDYSVRGNSLMSLPMGNAIPSFGDLRHATVIRHREFIQDITAAGSTVFTNVSFAINPGLVSTFPWLSQLAQCYDQYQFSGLVFEFVSTCSDNSSALPVGSIIMATDYDAADSAYTSKLTMENSQYCVSGKPSCNLTHPIECDPSYTNQPVKYLRGAAQSSGTDIRQYDVGNFQIATVGLSASSGNIGELWVSYEVALIKPQLQASNLFRVDHFNLGATWGTTVATGLGTTPAIAIAKVAETGSNLGFSILNESSFSIPRDTAVGRYAMFGKWLGASAALTSAVTVTYGTGLTALSIQNNNTSALSGAAGGETGAQQWFLATFQITAILSAASTIAFATGTLPGTPAAGDIFFWRMPENID